MAISEEAKKHYQKALAFKNELNPGAVLIEIQAALAIETSAQLMNRSAGREWDGATLIEFQMLAAWASLSVQDYWQLNGDILRIEQLMKIDSSLQANPHDLKLLVDAVKNWRERITTPAGQKAEVSKLYLRAWDAYEQKDPNQTTNLLMQIYSCDVDQKTNNDYLFLRAWTAYVLGHIEAAHAMLPKTENAEAGDRERIIHLRTSIEDAIGKSRSRIEQAEIALGKGDLSEMLAAYHDSAKAPLPPGIVWKSIRLQRGRVKPLPLQSKFGGCPDLPEHISWPRKDENTLLSFLCQMNLSEFEFDVPLPKSGILFFFYDADEQPWGRYADGKADWRVIYCSDPVADREYVAGAHMPPVVFDERLMEAKFEDTLPEMSSIEDFDLSIPDFDSYPASLETFYGESPWHRMFGHAQFIQSPINDTVIENAIHDVTGDPRKLKASTNRWKLLLQLDSDGDMVWGDTGRLYFFIDEQDLLAKNFDNVWFELQCY